VRRLLLVSVLATIALAAISPIASAQRVTHRKHVFSFSIGTAAGDFCDFNWATRTTITTHSIIFGPPSNPSREIDHLRYQAVNVNLDTGVRILEDDRYTIVFTRSNQHLKFVGAYWHLTDANGKRVKVSAGQFIVDLRHGGYVKQTPHIDPGFADVICTTLGGHAAIG
jgi:hypothetical protein